MNTSIKILTILLLVILFFNSHGNGNQTNEKQPPNIILILADDMGFGDLSCFGATQYKTPNLDNLAIQGMRFTHFYVPHAVCSASRASLLTGCYSNRIGISGALNPHSEIGLAPEEETIANLLKNKGYVTAAIGKWHLGHHEKFLPLQQGFDEYLGLPYSNDMWPLYYDNTRNIPSDYKRKLTFPELPLIKNNSIIKELTTIEDQAELTTLYTETATNFIKRNKDNPFFLYVAHSMPHVPLAVSQKFKGKSEQGLYGDVLMELDWSVGQIVNTLEENGLTDNTLIIFTSDNGPWLNFGNHAGSTAGLREGKGTSYDGGMRVPCIMKWPKQIPEGEICNTFASTIDILPTIASLTDSPLPLKKIDGENISSLMKGEKDLNPQRVFYFYYGKNQLEGIYKAGWKLVFPHEYRTYEKNAPGKDGLPGALSTKTSTTELYDLRRDAGERYNVIESYANIAKELMDLAEKARDDLGDELTNRPGENRRESGSIGKE
jgi:arylsulfatase